MEKICSNLGKSEEKFVKLKFRPCVSEAAISTFSQEQIISVQICPENNLPSHLGSRFWQKGPVCIDNEISINLAELDDDKRIEGSDFFCRVRR